MHEQAQAKRDGVINPQNYNFKQLLTRKILMLSKRYESREVDRRTWLHVPSGTHWSTSSDIRQVVEIIKDVKWYAILFGKGPRNMWLEIAGGIKISHTYYNRYIIPSRVISFVLLACSSQACTNSSPKDTMSTY